MMGALVQLLPHHHRLRPAKGGSAPSSPCPWLPDRPAFRRITSLCLRSGPQSGSPLDQAQPLRGGRDFYARAFSPAGHPTAKSGITTQLSGPLLRRDLHPLGECCYGLRLLPQALPQGVDLALQITLLDARILGERRRAVLEELLLPSVEQRGT